MKRGTLYAVGVGPGKAGHLTLLAAETLRACPVIAAPRTGGGHMLALEIAQKAVPLADKTVLPLDFAMKRGEAERESAYAAAERALCAVLDAGQDIALVNLGDVSIYASGQYLLERIRQKGYAAVMVPGIPSFCAAAARSVSVFRRGGWRNSFPRLRGKSWNRKGCGLYTARRERTRRLRWSRPCAARSQGCARCRRFA